MLISVVIPCYNRASLIAETLDSVASQTYAYWECLVIDDGSTDDSEAVVQRYCERDTRFKFYKRPSSKPKGANACRNYGLELSEGNYVVFLDSDDLLQPFCLNQRIAFIEKNSIDMLLSHTGVFNSIVGDSALIWNEIPVESSLEDLILRFLKSDIVCSTTGVTWSKSYLQRIGGWNESLMAWQDWELHVRALLYSPLLKVMEMSHQPDSFWRRDSVSSIGKTYRSKTYMLSLQYAAVSIDHCLRVSEIKHKGVLEAFRRFVYLRLVYTPLEKGYHFLPLKVSLSVRFLKYVNRFRFIKVYLVQLFAKSTYLKPVVKHSYRKQQSLFETQSTHLKLSVNDLTKR